MRTFPNPGFYCYDATITYSNETFDIDEYCVYITGTTKGNKYRSLKGHGKQWNNLLWTCVPGAKELAQYRYFSYNPTTEQI